MQTEKAYAVCIPAYSTNDLVKINPLNRSLEDIYEESEEQGESDKFDVGDEGEDEEEPENKPTMFLMLKMFIS